MGRDAVLANDLLPVAANLTPDVVVAEISAPIPGRNGLFAANNQESRTPLPQTSESLGTEPLLEQVDRKLGCRWCGIM